jgi:CHAT domain-containing protein
VSQAVSVPAARMAAVIVLCSLSVACGGTKKRAGEVGERDSKAALRPVQPRLTGFPHWQGCREISSPLRLVATSRCGDPPGTTPAVSTPGNDCDEMTKTHTEALQTLAAYDQCTDAVVDSLQTMAATQATASVLNDLAASYYVRAQRRDQPSDLVRALSAVQRALAADSRLPEARFNLALMQEALGFSFDSLASWSALEKADRSQWATEAMEHRKRLSRELTVNAATQWPLDQRRLAVAMDTGDGGAIADLVARHPAAAQRYVEEELLPEWAHTPVTAPERGERPLRLAEAIAEAWTRLTHDPYLREGVAAIRKAQADPRALEVLRDAHAAFQEARSQQRALRPNAAARFYRKAEGSFRQAGSPLSGEAAVGLAVALSYAEGADKALMGLDAVEADAVLRGHASLLASIHYIRGFLLFYANRYLESLAQYDAAIDIYRRIGDEEGLANAHTRKIGVFRTLGQNDLASREAMLARRYSAHLVGTAARHILLGETAASAMALGYPDVALLDQNTAVRLIQDELGATPPDQAVVIAGLRKNLAIAMRGRAEFELHLDDYDQARRDLDTAIQLASGGEKNADETMRRTLLARIEEINGRSLLGTDPGGAAEAFTRALALAIPDEYRTFRAMVLAERAQAHRCAGRKDLAKRDLRAALNEIREEETSLLRYRPPGGGETIWSRYFARFAETNQELIRQLVAEDSLVEAFAHAESARAFEPLNLILQLRQLPESFRRLTGDGRMPGLRKIQSELPPGTFLIAYTVLEDETYAWIVSHKGFDLRILPVPAKRIDGWAEMLRRAARHKDATAFEAALVQPAAELIAEPLAAVRKMAAAEKGEPRLVFIPDGSIHGLPLAALRDPGTGRRVFEEAPVAIAGSATLYIFSLMKNRDLEADEAPWALLVGDPAFDRRLPESRGVDRLPLARREVDRIREIYRPHADVRAGDEATVSDFLERAQRSAVVHLAGHAIANPDVPSRSLFLLAPSGRDRGILDATELLTNLRTQKSRLFVLSACSSAGGVPIGPEGLAPLVRPLIAAGVPGVVGTLWNVNDGGAEELMVRFHTHYREGFDAARALQFAQLELMRDTKPGLQSILTWAPYQVVGYASSPFPSITKSGRRVSQ